MGHKSDLFQQEIVWIKLEHFLASCLCSLWQTCSREHVLISGTSTLAVSACPSLAYFCNSQEHQTHPLSSIHWYYMSASIPITISPEVDYNWWCTESCCNWLWCCAILMQHVACYLCMCDVSVHDWTAKVKHWSNLIWIIFVIDLHYLSLTHKPTHKHKHTQFLQPILLIFSHHSCLRAA